MRGEAILRATKDCVEARIFSRSRGAGGRVPRPVVDDRIRPYAASRRTKLRRRSLDALDLRRARPARPLQILENQAGCVRSVPQLPAILELFLGSPWSRSANSLRDGLVLVRIQHTPQIPQLGAHLDAQPSSDASATAWRLDVFRRVEQQNSDAALGEALGCPGPSRLRCYSPPAQRHLDQGFAVSRGEAERRQRGEEPEETHAAVPLLPFRRIARLPFRCSHQFSFKLVQPVMNDDAASGQGLLVRNSASQQVMPSDYFCRPRAADVKVGAGRVGS